MVRGAPAPRGLPRASASPSTSRDAGRDRAQPRRARRAGRARRRAAARSTCSCSRAGATRRSARAWPGRSAGWRSGSLVALPMLAPRRRRGRGQLHDRLPHRALALARQPLRLPPALRVLRGARRGAARGCCSGASLLALVLRGLAILAASSSSSASTSSSTCSASCCCTWPGGSCAAWARRSTPARTPWCGWCGASSRSARTTRARASSPTPPATGPPRRSCSRSRRSSPRTSPSPSTRSRPRSRSRRDSFAIWAANAFALLGLRSLFALVEELVRRFRYLDETIAVVLATVAVKLLIEDVVHIGPGRQPGDRRRLLRRRGSRPPCWATGATPRAPPRAGPTATPSCGPPSVARAAARPGGGSRRG